MAYRARLIKLTRSLRTLDAYLITNMKNLRYLTGFTGSSGLAIVGKNKMIFVTDFRYTEQAEREVLKEMHASPTLKTEFKIRIEKGSMTPNDIESISRKHGIGNLGVEESVPHGFFLRLSARMPEIKAVRGEVEKLREIKDAEEVENIIIAVRRAEEAFIKIKPYIKAGVKERAIASRLEERLKKSGCRRLPFDIICASGPNSAMPHAAATERKLQAGDLVTIDWGGEAEGYFSDMTRTFLIRGKDMGKKKEIYGLVLEANKKGISAVSPGVGSKKIDETARGIITKAGYGKFFGHGLGHGVGLEIHEGPRISWTHNTPIKEKMVFTIEPGIYVSGLGGVRIEDMVQVSAGGAKALTSLPKKLEII